MAKSFIEVVQDSPRAGLDIPVGFHNLTSTQKENDSLYQIESIYLY